MNVWGYFHTALNCFLIDSIICVGYFVKELVTGGSGDVSGINNMLERNDNLYKLKSIERYIVYSVVSLVPIEFPVAYIFTMPYFLNLLADIIFPSVLQVRAVSKMFGEYIVCKLVIKGMNSLHKGIIPIKNYNIFALVRTMREITTIHIAFKTLLYVSFLNYLRAYNSTYVYYKAIKYSQYYQTGHYFAKYTVNEAVNILNDFVDKKDWRGLSDISVVNGLYTLIAHKLGQRRTAINFKLQLYKFYALWNFIFIMQSLTWYIAMASFVIHMSLYFTWRTVFFWATMSAMLISGESSIVCSIIVMLVDVWMFLIREAVFFISNLNEMEVLMKSTDVEEYEVVD